MSAARYSDAVLEHLRNPRNLGSIENAPDVWIGEAGAAAGGRLIRLHLRVGADQRIAEARFKAFGCPATIAAASYLTEQLLGRSIDEARTLAPEPIVVALALSEELASSADAAVQALRAALASQSPLTPGV